MLNPFKVVEDRCPECKAKLDSATPLIEDTARPAPGDYSICLTCGALLVFEKNLRVRLLSLAEMETMEFTLVSALLEARARVRLLRDRRDKGLI